MFFRPQPGDVLFIKEAIMFDLETCVYLIAIPAQQKTLNAMTGKWKTALCTRWTEKMSCTLVGG